MTHLTKTQILSEQFLRMQRLAGIISETKYRELSTLRLDNNRLNEEEDAPVDDELKQSFSKPVPSFVEDLSKYMQDSKVKAIFQSGLADGDPDDDKLPYSKTNVGVGKLTPTQNEIGFDQSIINVLTDPYGSLKSILSGNADVGGPIVTYAGKYIIDGHHRWSQVYAANPGANMQALDIKGKTGFQPDDILKAVHTSIAVKLGKVPSANPEGINIMGGIGYDKVVEKVEENLKEKAFDIWKESGFDTKEKIAKHLFKNLQSIIKNGYISSAPGRAYMPQTDGEKTNPEDKLKALASGEINISPPFAK